MREICKATTLWSSMEIAASIPWNPGVKGKARKASWTLSIRKWACLANGLVLFLVKKGSSLLAMVFPFLFLFVYHLLIRITYRKIAISPCHCPQTLRTRKFMSRVVKSNLIQPEHWFWHATLLWIIPLSCPLLASWTVPRATEEQQNLYLSLAKWVAVPKTRNTGNRTWIHTDIIAPAFSNVRNLERIWIVVRYALNIADIRSKLHDCRLVYFNQDKRNESLSDPERNYCSCSEEIVLTKQRGIGFGAFLSLGMIVTPAATMPKILYLRANTVCGCADRHLC